MVGAVLVLLATAGAGCGLFGLGRHGGGEAREPAIGPVPVAEAGDLWGQVAEVAAGVSPVLEPGYLPPGLDVVQAESVERGVFSVEYVGQGCRLAVAAGPTSLPMVTTQEKTTARGQAAVLYILDPGDPKGSLVLSWYEPGSWSPDAAAPDRMADAVHYVVSAQGLGREDVERFAEELEPGR